MLKTKTQNDINFNCHCYSVDLIGYFGYFLSSDANRTLKGNPKKYQMLFAHSRPYRMETQQRFCTLKTSIF